MKNIFKKDTQIENDEDIIVLKKTKPIECGGTDATQDRKAPKAIISKDMYYFETESALGYVDIYSEEDPLAYINAFAVKTEKGSFISLETRGGRYYDEKKQYLAYVTYDIFPELVKLVNDNEIAKDNGFHSRTHGLPEDFGGSVNIRYASGEKISFSDNQSPILSMKVAKLIRQVFLNALKKEPVVLKDIKSLKEIRFHEEFDGGYVNVTLKINDDDVKTFKMLHDINQISELWLNYIKYIIEEELSK